MQASSDHASSRRSAERWARRLRRIRRWLVAFVLLISVVAVAGIPVYVRPQVDPLQRADAVFVIGGYDAASRYPFGVDLAEAGWAPNVVLSDPAHSRWMAQWCEYFKPPPPLASIRCVTPVPDTTLGEGRELNRLARENGWRKAIIVTHRSHISRARFILGRCFNGQLIMVDFPTRMSLAQWAFQYVYQTFGYAKAILFDRKC